MGVIRSQAIKGSVFAYLGIAVGFVNAIVLAPRVLTTAEIGLTSILITYSFPFVLLSSLGFKGVITRMFPYFRDRDSRHHGFLALGLTVTLAGFIMAMAVFYVVKPAIVRDNAEHSPLILEYLFYLVPLIFFTLFFNLLDAYNRVLYDAVLGTFLKEFLFRIIYTVVLLAFLFHWINFPQFVLAFISVQSLPTVIIAAVLIYRGQFSLRFELDFISRRMRKLMVNICLFSFVSGFSGIAISSVDRWMINSMIDLSATGIYTVSFYFSVLLMVPVKSVRYISTPVIAESMKAKNFGQLQTIYYKSALNQLVIGLLIFIGIWANVNNIFEILPKEYEAGKWVIFFMMLAKLFELSTGVASTIIGTSRYYRYQTYLILGLLVLLVVSNLIFIPVYGIVGAALASSICALLYNLARFILVYVKFGMQPYNYRFAVLIGITLACYFGSLLLPAFEKVIVDIFVRSAAIALVFTGLVLLFRVSDDVADQASAVLKWLGINKRN